MGYISYTVPTTANIFQVLAANKARQKLGYFSLKDKSMANTKFGKNRVSPKEMVPVLKSITIMRERLVKL